MTYKEYYNKLKKQNRQKRVDSKKRQSSGEKLYSRGMYDQPKRNAGDKNYVNTPPMNNPPNYTPTDTGGSR